MFRKSAEMKVFKKLLRMWMLLMVVSCSTWQEPQIDNEVVEIFIPRDSLVTDIATQLFYWYGVEWALKYELQIASPNFARIDRLMLDTNVTDTKFEFTLPPGEYEWSLRAYNGSSSTGYTVHKLYIDSTLDLSNQTLVLMKPADRDTSNRGLYLFEWQNLYNADYYRFELYQPNIGGQLITSREVQSDTLKYRPQIEGAFEWRVKAINSGSQTTYFNREFYRDATPPQAPVLTSPPNDDFINNGIVDFTWNSSSEGGASIRDSLFLNTDSTFALKPYARYSTQKGELQVDTLSSGTYYWRVRSYDKAGNIGSWSVGRKFILQ